MKKTIQVELKEGIKILLAIDRVKSEFVADINNKDISDKMKELSKKSLAEWENLYRKIEEQLQ